MEAFRTASPLPFFLLFFLEDDLYTCVVSPCNAEDRSDIPLFTWQPRSTSLGGMELELANERQIISLPN